MSDSTPSPRIPRSAARAWVVALAGGIGMGVAFGTSLGVALGNVAVGIALGFALGAVFAGVFAAASARRRGTSAARQEPPAGDR
ncbi:hypothetical protein ACI3KY_13580 [Microbacterium sp. ZW T2_14]|uniref:hypothetical protein n=1 Tax=Microbacterium sp. ZW T2_14 TaxID=3378079 RepID=UPI003854FB89